MGCGVWLAFVAGVLYIAAAIFDRVERLLWGED
jgi:hypothetical protein